MRTQVKKSSYFLSAQNTDFMWSFRLPVGYSLRAIGVKVLPLRGAGVSLRLKVDGRTTHEIDRDCARALEKITTGKNKRGWFFLHDIHQSLEKAFDAQVELEFSGVRWPAKVFLMTIEEWRI